MGNLGDPDNTFWQLVALRGGPRWTLTTPPGVASNGGMAVSVDLSGPVLAGFGPSQYRDFSPLAASTDGGTTWSPGVLPGGLAPFPDALASEGHITLALLASDGGRVVESTGGLGSWRALVGAHRIAEVTSSRECVVTRLTSVALVDFGTGGGPVPTVGASCAGGDRAGVFAHVGQRWVAVGPGLLPATRTSEEPTQVLRLSPTPTGVAVLVSEGSGARTRLYAAWSDGSSWTLSAALPLGVRRLSSVSVTARKGFVVTVMGAGTPAWTTASPTSSTIPTNQGQSAPGWRAIASPPPGSALVAPTPPGGFDALVVDHSKLTVFSLVAGRWQQTQVLDVPIQYGSSS
jgi:hypothetical protein